KNKKASKAEPESVQEESTKATADEEPMPTSISRPKKSKKSKQSESKPAPEPANDDFAGFESEDDGSEDEGNDAADHTAALLAGFESEDEESGAETGMDVEKLPAAPISAKARKQLSKANSADKPGTIYVGRIPHGFYEPQMQAYFSQFGNVTRLRLSRNKLTGRSKHYAFIEFDSAAVADVVVKTMDNYLLYQHILKVRRVPDDQVHPDLWKGANHRFKAIPRARIEARRLERPADREVWEKRVDREVKRRRAREQKLKASGLDYTFEAPRVKLVADVARKEPAAVAETEPESPADAPEVKMLDAPKEVQ
ncbi:RNA-binding domain-containing protein, partial [Trichodelitschia bisporula]